MTPEQEYEEAVEAVAAHITECTVEYFRKRGESFQDYFKDKARAILTLTWPSGQPVIGVLSQDQTLPQHNPVDAANSEFTYPDAYMHAQSDMFRAGFRRVVQEKR